VWQSVPSVSHHRVCCLHEWSDAFTRRRRSSSNAAPGGSKVSVFAHGGPFLLFCIKLFCLQWLRKAEMARLDLVSAALHSLHKCGTHKLRDRSKGLAVGYKKKMQLLGQQQLHSCFCFLAAAAAKACSMVCFPFCSASCALRFLSLTSAWLHALHFVPAAYHLWLCVLLHWATERPALNLHSSRFELSAFIREQRGIATAAIAHLEPHCLRVLQANGGHVRLSIRNSQGQQQITHQGNGIEHSGHDVALQGPAIVSQ
jgi:hypothetical protein